MKLHERLQVMWKLQLIDEEQLYREMSTVDRLRYWCGWAKKEVAGGLLKFKPPASTGGKAAYKGEQLTRCVAIVGLPQQISPFELVEGFLSGYLHELDHIKVVQTAQPKHYAVLLRLIRPRFFEEIIRNWSGRVYNALEPARIIIRQVYSVQFVTSELSFFKFLMTRMELPETKSLYPDFIFETEASELVAQNHSYLCQLCHYELRTDAPREIVVTTLCCHSFHLKCLMQFSEKEQGCPVCRSRVWPQPTSNCELCPEREQIWMCQECFRRLCGLVDTTVLSKSHAFQHIRQTGHRRFVSLDRLNSMEFRKPETKLQIPPKFQSTIDLLGPNVNISKRQLLEECLRLEVRLVKQSLREQEDRFEQVSIRISKEADERLERERRRYKQLKTELEATKVPDPIFEQDEQEVAKLQRQLQVQLKVKKLMSDRVDSILNGIITLKDAEPSIISQLELRIRKVREQLNSLADSRQQQQAHQRRPQLKEIKQMQKASD